MDFSVLLSVYKNDNREHFRRAVESVAVNQTCIPSEIVIVIDGPVPEDLRKEIISLATDHDIIRLKWLERNGGLGNALRIGMEAVSYDIVARMDADDISLPYRFEKQINFLESNPDISVVGGQISEFIDNESNIVAHRNVPLFSEDCEKYYQDRDPLNHMTVMFRRNDVMAVGNYQPWHLDEDTFLWGRLLKGGYKIANLPDILVNVRVGDQMYARRGGWKYFKSDSKILSWKLKNGLTSKSRFVYNYLARFVVQVLMPNKMRAWIFKRFLRS